MQSTQNTLPGFLKKIFFAGIASALTLTAGNLSAQPLDCSLPEHIADRFICNDDSLKQVNQQIYELYQKQNSNLLNRLHAQFQEDRNTCTHKDCIVESLNAEMALYHDLSTQFSLEKNKSRDSYKNILKERTDEQKIYTVRDEPWLRVSLADFDSSIPIDLLDAIYKDGVLYAFVNANKSVYEYNSAQDKTFKLFEETDNLKYIRTHSSITGIQGDHFYFKTKLEQNLEASYRYKIGSNLPAETSAIAYTHSELEQRDSWAQVKNHEQITLRYYGKSSHDVHETIAQNEILSDERMLDDWSADNFVWNPYMPVLYFDNSGASACIWRSDMITQETVKIVPEHEAIQPRPIYIGSREAVLYVENNALKIAVAPAAQK